MAVSDGNVIITLRINEAIFELSVPFFDLKTSSKLTNDNEFTVQYVKNLIKIKQLPLDEDLYQIKRIFDDEEEIEIYKVNNNEEEFSSLSNSSGTIISRPSPKKSTQDQECTEIDETEKSSNIETLKDPCLSHNSVNTKSTQEWTDGATKLMLDKYEFYMKQIGPMKKFKNKKSMWEKIATDIYDLLALKYTATQTENRYKTVLKRKKNAIDNNSTSGSSRHEIPFESELSKIASIDDSILPEVMRSANNVRISIEKRSDSETSNKENSPKIRKLSVQETLLSIHREKEENRERRHKEKMELIKSLFNKDKD